MTTPLFALGFSLLIGAQASPPVGQFPPPPQVSPVTPTAAVPAPPSANDPRLQTVVYDVNRVVRLNVAPRYQLTLILGADERVENVAVGDADAWQVTPNNRGDSLFLKSLRAGGSTNMTVITDLRVYSFELNAAHAPGPDTPFTVRFRYPDAASTSPGAPTADTVGRYRLSGARALRPVAISDDGVRTTIEWRQQQTLPVVFAIDERGDEILLDGAMRDGLYVIDGVHRVLLFRVEKQTARASRARPRPAR